MDYHFMFSYLECQGCHERVNCNVCEKKLLDKMSMQNRIRCTSVNMLKRTIDLETDFLSEDDVLDELEMYGVFAD